MLSKEELSRYGTATLTAVFLDRVYQECLTYDGEMVTQSFIARFQLFQSIQLKSIIKQLWPSIKFNKLALELCINYFRKKTVADVPYPIYLCFSHCSLCPPPPPRTTRPTWTLCWPWRTGRSPQLCSTSLNCWTWRTRDTSLSSPSTTSLGYRAPNTYTSTRLMQ